LKESAAKRFIRPNEQLNVSTKIDPSIIGGIILQIGDRTLDMSIASRLRKIMHTLA
jgi:F-type H+-transporting ATPase subunit O